MRQKNKFSSRKSFEVGNLIYHMRMFLCTAVEESLESLLVDVGNGRFMSLVKIFCWLFLLLLFLIPLLLC